MKQDNTSEKTVAVLGASPKPARYSNQAVAKLLEYGHRVFPVNPVVDKIHGQRCYKKLEDIPVALDTLTLYIGPERSTPLIDTILQLAPARIIMNPGAENDALEAQALEHGIEVVRGCTLVMLSTKQF